MEVDKQVNHDFSVHVVSDTSGLDTYFRNLRIDSDVHFVTSRGCAQVEQRVTQTKAGVDEQTISDFIDKGCARIVRSKESKNCTVDPTTKFISGRIKRSSRLTRKAAYLARLSEGGYLLPLSDSTLHLIKRCGAWTTESGCYRTEHGQ